MLFCNIALSESSLPECEGNNIKEWVKKFTKVRKWTNCYGSFTGPNGATYVGEFYKGKFHGIGTFTANGRKYVGEWKNHNQHGKGTYTYANGDKYEGEFKKGKYDGGYTGFPQFGVCVDVREGDFLGMDVHEWHCNTKLKQITKYFSRVSLVAYLREDMLKCKGMKL